MSDNKLFHWSEESIRWYTNAESYDMFHREIKDIILRLLPDMPRICDAGCGIGTLTFFLAPQCRSITALDIALRPLEVIQQRAEKMNLSNISTMHGDFTVLPPPEEKYDAVVFCMSGSISKFYDSAVNWSRNKLIFIQNTTPYRSFSATGRTDKTVVCHDDCEYLTSRGIRYNSYKMTAPLGQPFESREDADYFMAYYDKHSTDADRKAFLDSHLIPGDDPRYPLFLPSKKHFMVFEIDVP